MRPDEWIELMEKIRDGEFENINIQPTINILGMKITDIGINMMTVREQYGEELDTDRIDFTYKKGAKEHAQVNHFANAPEHDIEPILEVTTPKSEKKDVKKLFRKRKKR